jgi:TRAP-type transport system small permease protein
MRILKPSNAYEKAIYQISRVLSVAGMVVLIGMMLLTVSDVFLRYAFRHPILGSTEITEYMMVFLALGMGWCLLQGRSIRMDMIVERFSPRSQAVVDTVTYIISLGILGFMGWRTLSESIAVHKIMLVSSTLRIPAYPFYGILALGLIIFGLAILVNLINSIVKVIKP